MLPHVILFYFNSKYWQAGYFLSHHFVIHLVNTIAKGVAR